MGVEIISELIQKNNGEFPLVDSNNIRGGFYQVSTIVERDAIPTQRKKEGMLVYTTSDKTYWRLESGVWVEAKFGSSFSGIPLVDQEIIDSGVELPDKYVTIGDEKTDTEQYPLSREIKATGTYTDILFKAIRSLQHEVAKLKNSFNTGIISYTDEHTASSDVITEDEEAEEPLWAIDPEDLAEVSSIYINSETQLLPVNGRVINENSITCTDCYVDVDTSEVEETQLVNYTIIDPKDGWDFIIGLTNDMSISLASFIDKQKCNVFTLLCRKENAQYIYISITNSNNQVILNGYINNEGNLQATQYSFQGKDLGFNKLTFKNLDLYKSTISSRAQSFTNEDLIPTQPQTDDYSFKAAHITIRSVKTKEILNKLSDRILNNELIWVESDSQLYIKSKYKLIAIGSKSGGDDSGMTEEEVKQWLIDNNYITSNGQLQSANLAPIADITFIHEDSNKKFKVTVDSEGNLKGTEIVKYKEDTGNPSETSVKRGTVAYYNAGTKYETNKASDLSNVTTSSDGVSIYVLGDRVRISEWYIPNLGQTQFNCTHDFIELTNCGTVDYPLGNAVVYLLKKVDTKYQVEKFELDGVVPAGASYLIRGKQRLDLDSEIAHMKISTYDKELWKDGSLYDMSGVLGIVLCHKNLSLSVDSDNKTALKSNWKSTADSEGFLGSINPNLIDVVLWDTDAQNYFKDGSANTWVDKTYTNPTNSVVKDQYLLDPAKQAFRSLTSTTETSNCRLNKVAQETIPLAEEKISFYHSEQTVPVTNYTPKASHENSNVCTDKTRLDANKPNMVTCAFGINGYTTRTFNWVSVGEYNEYCWIRKKGTETWKRFESYKAGDDTLTQSTTYPRKRIFNKTITDSVYKRIIGDFPANGQHYTSHKLILDIVETPVANATYEYIVGRSLKNGNFDPEHCSDIQTFTLHDSTWTPRVYQITDQQGFGWMEYQVWSATANELYSKITKECTETTKQFPVIINTGDMTQNGTRINEWYDYYCSGSNLASKYEQMYVIGNNDLANSYSPNFLGTGDDNGKSSPYYYNLFYCYEVPSDDFTEVDNWQHPLIYNNVYIPSTYYFYFDKQGYLMINSELTTVTCNVYYKATANSGIINLYTGFNSNTKEFTSYSLSQTIQSMITKMQGKNIIAACHEMPFTVVNLAYLKGVGGSDMTCASADRCIQYKALPSTTSKSLIGSHMNRISSDDVYDSDNNYWFSRMLENNGITLCIGGHKHTYCCTYPVREWKSGDATQTSVSTTKQAVIKRDDYSTVDGNKVIRATEDCFYWNVDPDLKTGVVYFMLQASGFKLASNKELPSREQVFSKIVPESDTTASKPDVSQSYPMYAVISYDTSNYNIDLYRVSGIKVETISQNKAAITEFSELKYSTEPMYSEKLLAVKKGVTSTDPLGVYYTNYWLVDSSVKNYAVDKQRCYWENSQLKSVTEVIPGTWNNTEHTETVPYKY